VALVVIWPASNDVLQADTLNLALVATSRYVGEAEGGLDERLADEWM
jgi:hypothetical protein